MKLKKQTIIFFLILVVVATVVKILCAPEINLSGFTAVIAISLFAGLTVKDKKLAFVLPLFTLFISDIIIEVLHQFHLFPFAGFYGGQVYNYVLFFVLTFLGMSLRNYKTAGIFTAAIVGPTVFFLLSNFIVWKAGAVSMGYNTDITGLWQSYTFGLPFYRNSLISTIIFLPAFVALYNRMIYGKASLSKAV